MAKMTQKDIKYVEGRLHSIKQAKTNAYKIMLDSSLKSSDQVKSEAKRYYSRHTQEFFTITMEMLEESKYTNIVEVLLNSDIAKENHKLRESNDKLYLDYSRELSNEITKILDEIHLGDSVEALEAIRRLEAIEPK